MTTDEIFSLRQLIREEFHPGMKALMSELLIEELVSIKHKLDTIIMNQSDEAVALQAIADDLVKVKAGIDALKQSVADLTAQLANVQTTPAVDAALANVQANLAQVDADLPTPVPPVPPPPQ